MEDLGGVHGALKLALVIHHIGSDVALRDRVELVAEVVCLLVESLLSNVVLDVLQVLLRYWKLSRLVRQWQENLLEGLLDLVAISRNGD